LKIYKNNKGESEVEQKPLIVVGICVVVLLILGSLSTVVGYQTVQSSNEEVTVKISYSTFDGVEQVEREISRQDSHHLSTLMSGSDNEALAYELLKLGLVPSSINMEQLKKLLSGDYTKTDVVRYNEILNDYLSNERFNGTKRNFFCVVQGDARDCIYLAAAEMFLIGIGFTTAMLGLYLAKHFPSIFPIIPFPFLYGSVGILFLIGLGLGMLGNYLYLFRISSFRAIPVLVSDLSDGPHEQKANLSTRGLLGSWSIQSFDIDMFLIGFVGVWITIIDSMNENGCKFRGFSLYVAAKEYE